MNELFIYLDPFKVSFFEQAIKDKVLVGADVHWCCLADLLVTKNNSELVGFSFEIENEHKEFVLEFVRNNVNPKLRYIQNFSEIAKTRYDGFGSQDRLEIYVIDSEETDVACQFSSLDTGSWLYDIDDIGNLLNKKPHGFHVDIFDDIECIHGVEITKLKALIKNNKNN